MNTNKSIKGIQSLDNKELMERIFSKLRGRIDIPNSELLYLREVEKEMFVRLSRLQIQAKSLSINHIDTRTLTSDDLSKEDYNAMISKLHALSLVKNQLFGIGVSKRVYEMLKLLPAGDGNNYLGNFSIEFRVSASVEYSGIKVAIDKRLNGSIEEYKMVYGFQEWIDYMKELESINKGETNE